MNTDPARDHSARSVNRRIDRDSLASLERTASTAAAREARLGRLSREWDVERYLEATAASFVLAGLALSAKDRRWLLLSGSVAGFLLQHALSGWCPPLPVFRRLFGARTAREIERERIALKTARGDLDAAVRATEPVERARQAFDALI